ncbi:hypothetical protein AMTRI_Chr06g196150 [Amborella trichopoda]
MVPSLTPSLTGSLPHFLCASPLLHAFSHTLIGVTTSHALSHDRAPSPHSLSRHSSTLPFLPKSAPSIFTLNQPHFFPKSALPNNPIFTPNQPHTIAQFLS